MSELLLIDDDESLTELLGSYLENQGHSVRIAGDGKDGIRALFSRSPDLVVLDVTMPKRDGWETLERIREVSDMPVIMLTGIGERTGVKTSSSDMAGFLGSEPEAYIDKPIEPAILRQTVNRLLKK